MQKGTKIAIGIIAGLGLVYAGIRVYGKVPDVTVEYDKKTGKGTIAYAGKLIEFDKNATSAVAGNFKTWNGVEAGVSGNPISKVFVRKNGKTLLESSLDGYASSGSSSGAFNFNINRKEA